MLKFKQKVVLLIHVYECILNPNTRIWMEFVNLSTVINIERALKNV